MDPSGMEVVNEQSQPYFQEDEEEEHQEDQIVDINTGEE